MMFSVLVTASADRSTQMESEMEMQCKEPLTQWHSSVFHQSVTNGSKKWSSYTTELLRQVETQKNQGGNVLNEASPFRTTQGGGWGGGWVDKTHELHTRDCTSFTRLRCRQLKMALKLNVTVPKNCDTEQTKTKTELQAALQPSLPRRTTGQRAVSKESGSLFAWRNHHGNWWWIYNLVWIRWCSEFWFKISCRAE